MERSIFGVSPEPNADNVYWPIQSPKVIRDLEVKRTLDLINLGA